MKKILGSGSLILKTATCSICILLCLMGKSSKAQSNYKITGKLLTAWGSPVDGSIIFTKTSDSSLIKGDFVINGLINFETSQKSVILQISAVGFRDTVIYINNEKNLPILELGNIVLEAEAKTLKEIIITKNRPMFEKKGEAVIVNVEKTMLSSSISMNEVLSKSPGVKVDEGKVSVFGKGEATIYLNGRIISNERLASIPVSQIKRVEIITNPSSKFDARGNAVINIITKQNNLKGLQGNVSQNLTQARYISSSTSMMLNYKISKWAFTGNLIFNKGRDWVKRTLSREIGTTSGIYKAYVDHVEITDQTKSFNYKAGIEYDINKSSDLSVQYEGLNNQNDLGVEDMLNMYSPGAASLTNIFTYNNGQSIFRNNSFNINYNNRVDTLGSTLFIGAQYSTFRTKIYDRIRERIKYDNLLNNEAFRVNDGGNKIGLYTVQVDYAKKGPKNGSFETGLKYEHAGNDGNIVFSSRQAGVDTFTVFPGLSNSFIYKEFITAGYIQYSNSVKDKWKYSLGIRLEHSNINGFSRVLNRNVIDSNFLNVFPSARLSYTVNNNVNISVSQSSRINRPVYQDFDPFSFYIDSLTSFRGNPRLIPELIHSTEATVGYKEYAVKLGYSFIKNPIRIFPRTERADANKVYFNKENLNDIQQYYVSVDIPYERGNFSTYNNIACTYYKLTDFNGNTTNSGSISPELYFYSYNQLTIPKYFTLDLSGEFISASNNGLFYSKPSLTFSTSITKSFYNNKLTCRIMANDFLKTYNVRGGSAVRNISSTYDRRFNTHYVRLTLTYKFGGLKQFERKNKQINSGQADRVSQ
jgi:hypothetical protein